MALPDCWLDFRKFRRDSFSYMEPKAVLEISPVDSAQKAAQVQIVKDVRKSQK
jgi:hypothetical protein